jgi:hypothetical protein
VHIIVYCPSCQRQYQLEPNLRGRQIICPNPACRVIFEVKESAPPPAAEPGGDNPSGSGNARQSYRTGSVGQLVPMLGAEEAGTWSDEGIEPPPVCERQASSPGAPDFAPVMSPASDEPSWQELAPPVRRPSQVEETSASKSAMPRELARQSEPPLAATAELDQEYQAPPPRPKGPWIVAGLVLGLVLAFGGVTWLLWLKSQQTEEQRFATATEEFSNGHYQKSAKSFNSLAVDFRDRPRANQYRFLGELSQALQPAYEIGGDPKEALQTLADLVQEYQENPLLQQHKKPVGEAFDKLGKELADQARQFLEQLDLPRARASLADARKALTLVHQWARRDPSAVAPIEEVALALTRAERRVAALARLKELKATAADIHQAQQLVAQESLQADAEARQIVDQLQETFLAQIAFVPAPEIVDPAPAETREPGLVVVSTVHDGATRADGVAFALANGVLYALTQRDGKFIWATRVGRDSTTLPVRWSSSELGGEVALVISSDSSHWLTARDVLTGQERWRYDLKAPCLAKPVLLGVRAFVPTYDGRVHEVDLVSGKSPGSYEVGLPFTVGGTPEEGSDRIYFPADSQYVYVFNVRQRKCVGILQTGHPSGSLRSGALIVRPDRGDPNAGGPVGAPSYLILNQVDGIGASKLRAFALDQDKIVQGPPLQPEISLQGWSWFPPSCDGEKIATTTDAGVFSLVGINQVRNQDTPLFPMLTHKFSTQLGARSQLTERSEVAHAGENDFWIAQGGKLQRWQASVDRVRGLQLRRIWESQPLGWPVHEAQVNDNRDTLFVVTHQPDRPDCLATAVDSASGQIHWQCRLGLMNQGDPLLVNGQVTVLDKEGNLFQFDPKLQAGAKRDWHAAGRPLSGRFNPTGWGASFLRVAPDGQTIYALTGPVRGHNLMVRRLASGKAPESKTFSLLAPLAGTPAVGMDYFIVPLADGSLVWQPWEGKPRFGTWRAPEAPRTSRGHVLLLGADQFVITDGNRGLSIRRWPPDGPPSEKKIELPDPLLGTPALLPGNQEVCVADIIGNITIVRLNDSTRVRQWTVAGKITAGPFVRGTAIGCVVDYNRLVWLNPANGSREDYFAAAEIVGQPEVVGDLLLVVDLSGQIVPLDAMSGKTAGPPIVARGSVSPAGTPVAFGSDRLFVPLSDGTIWTPVIRARKTVSAASGQQ